MRAWVGLLALGAVAACAPPTELAIDLHTDLEAGVDFTEVRSWLEQRPEPRAWTLPDADALRVGARIGAYEGLAPGPEEVTVRLVGADGETVGVGRRVLELEGTRATTVRVLARPRLVAGWGLSCARLGARLWCWGALDHLEPGRASTERVAPFEVARDVVDVCSSSIETCVLTTEGELSCVQHLPAEDPSAVIDTSHTGHEHVVLTCAGFLVTHRCMLDRDGRVRCSGNDQLGQLGDGPEESPTDHGGHVEVLGLTGVTELAPGNIHTCALSDAGRVGCWGSGGYGQIGDGREGDGVIAHAPVELDLTEIVTIDSFWATTCAVDARGNLYCWGQNDTGVVSDGGPMLEPSPVRSARVSGVERVAVGRGHVCVTLASDAAGVHCWGSNEQGQLGDGSLMARSSPVRVELPGRVLALDAHGAHTCALAEVDQALEVHCWGTNAQGELGDPALERSERPLEVELPGLQSQ